MNKEDLVNNSIEENISNNTDNTIPSTKKHKRSIVISI